ncbi:hypothetical protein [Flavobacterium pedocola]
MKTKQLLATTLLSLTSLFTFGQNVQSNALGTSGGLDAGTTTGAGGNTFYGWKAGKNSVTSYQSNTYIGSFSGSNTLSSSTISPNANTFVGAYSGNGATAGYSIFLGTNSGDFSVGYSNVFLGNGAGSYCIGNQNLLIGNGSGEELTGSKNIFIGNVNYVGLNAEEKLLIDNEQFDKPLIWGDFANDQLKFNAKVGVGYNFGNYPTTAGGASLSNYNLFVKGGILAEVVRVNLQSSWADYVFNKEYKLPTLEEIEKHIAEKGHLPNVPSAQKVKEEGIELGEMAKIQQEKIEELTLYIIEQNKINKKQSEEIEELKKMVLEMAQKK